MVLSGNENSEHFSGKLVSFWGFGGLCPPGPLPGLRPWSPRPPLICSTRDKFLATPLVPLPPCLTFEPICIQLTTSIVDRLFYSTCRPGSARPSASFFDEIVLEVLDFSCLVLVGGDINVHILQDNADVDARRLNELLASFDRTQHVGSPTNRLGGILSTWS